MQRTSLVSWALVAAVACWHLDAQTRPLTGDSRHYFFMAERASAGVPPHVSHVDTKNQLPVLLTSASLDVGRWWGLDEVLVSRVASLVAVGGAVALAAQLATLLTGTALAGHLAALAMIAARGFLDQAAIGSSVKGFLVAFVLLAHVALALAGRRAREGAGSGSSPRTLPWEDALAGAAGSAAFLCWQPALLVPAAVAVEAGLGRVGNWRRAAVVLVAAAIVVVAYESYFLLHGALTEQLTQAYRMPLGSLHEPRRLWASVLFVASEATRGAWPLRLGPLAFAALGGVFALRGLRSPAAASALVGARSGALAFALAGCGAVAFTIYDHQGIPDLFFPDAYFAVSVGVVFGWIVRRLPRAAPPVALAMAAMLLLQIGWDEIRRDVRGFTLEDQRSVAAQVRRLHDERGSVWAYEVVHLLGLAHLDNHVPYGLFYDDVATVLVPQNYLPLDEGRLPEVIVHGRERPPGSRHYLERDYEEVPSSMFEAQSVHVWRRRGGQGR